MTQTTLCAIILAMSTKQARQGYRERLSKGDVVYFVEGENIIGGGNLTVKKASVTSTVLPVATNAIIPT